MSINVPWLEVLKACYPNAQVIKIMIALMVITMMQLLKYCEVY